MLHFLVRKGAKGEVDRDFHEANRRFFRFMTLKYNTGMIFCYVYKKTRRNKKEYKNEKKQEEIQKREETIKKKRKETRSKKKKNARIIVPEGEIDRRRHAFQDLFRLLRRCQKRLCHSHGVDALRKQVRASVQQSARDHADGGRPVPRLDVLRLAQLHEHLRGGVENLGRRFVQQQSTNEARTAGLDVLRAMSSLQSIAMSAPPTCRCCQRLSR